MKIVFFSSNEYDSVINNVTNNSFFYRQLPLLVPSLGVAGFLTIVQRTITMKHLGLESLFKDHTNIFPVSELIPQHAMYGGKVNTH